MKTLEEMIEICRGLPVLASVRDEQRIDFAYGNLACSTNHRPNRQAFKELVMGALGWTEERFDLWAFDKEWWP